MPPTDDPDKDMRAPLDDDLDVGAWTRPSRLQPVRRGEPVASDAPSWWHGEEDASQMFLSAMGVHLD